MTKRFHWKGFFALFILSISACKSKQETVQPIVKSITESVYASGMLESENQYQVFAAVTGIVDKVFVDEGTLVEVGTPILSLSSEAQKLSSENAKLTADFNAFSLNSGKIDEARSLVNLIQSQVASDAAMLARQRNLWAQNIGSKVELEQRQLALAQSKNNLTSAKEKLRDLERQLELTSKQSQNSLSISQKNAEDFVVKSRIKGKIYKINVVKGEIVNPQIAVAIIGDQKKYLLKMQIDEYDIGAVQVGMPVVVVLNSYKDSVFDAVVTKINPIMNIQNKNFTIEAEFVRAPSLLYPNISFEANVIINTKKDALLIPRNYLLNDSIVLNKAGKRKIVKTGLKDFQMVEILSGIDAKEELVIPEQ